MLQFQTNYRLQNEKYGLLLVSKELANSYSGTACDVYEKISGKEVSAEARQKCANKMFKAADALDWISIGADLAN